MLPRSLNTSRVFVAFLLLLVPLSLLTPLSAEDWIAWRGAQQDGTSDAKNLVESWSQEGENLIWRQDFIGRSTPLVFNGRVFVQGRAGTGIDERELVAAFDAETGEQLWEVEIKAFLTTVPYNRAGWASPAADRESGTIYVQGVGGMFLALDEDGNTVWEKSLLEEYGRYSGYGGRTHTPLVDEDQVIISNITTGWGKLGAPRHRYYSFDKRTGELLWVSTPGGQPYDLNTQSNAVIAVINGQRLLVGGNADGHVYALKTRTGEKVWEFELSKRGINSTPLVVGSTVFIGHSEENIDEAVLGRTVAIDGSGTGDVTGTHEIWRQPYKMGFPSPGYHDGRLYVMDNSANLYAVNPENGEHFWEYSLGTVGKSAPVIADGKIYATEVNGRVHIVGLGDEPVRLDMDEVEMPNGRYAETYGSPAIAYGRIYLATEEGLYCIGDKDREFEVSPSPALKLPAEDRGSDKPTVIRVMPAEVEMTAGGTADYRAVAFNEKGRQLGEVDASWSLDGVAGSIDEDGVLTTAGDRSQAGEIVAKFGELEARARVRSFTGLPVTETFDIDGRGRAYWIGAGRYQVTELDGEKVLEKPVADRGLLRSKMFIGPHDLENYTITADVRGGQERRRKTDGGLINSGYILDLFGIDQKLEIRSWTAELRMAKSVPFEWEMDVWYTMKMRVDQFPDKAVIYGKVWKRGEPEPDEWTITAEDTRPVRRGAPGVQAYSPASFYFDNVRIESNS